MGKRQAGSNSKRQYERGADRMIAASAREAEFDWGAASPGNKVDGLLNYLGKDAVLCEGTVTHYVQCASVAIKRILAGSDVDDVFTSDAIDRARELLARRVGRPTPPRGASTALKDPSVAELGDVFAHLRSKFIESGDQLDLLLALYIIVMPRIGLRPVEMTWADWDGNGLYTYTAKRAGRPKRYIPHEHWPPVYKSALGLLVKLVPRELDDAEFERWRNRLASRLARASQWTRTKKRLSLYFARHIAIANWKQAGITPEIIAQLAGHAGLRSQHFYASGRAGYGARYVFLDHGEGQTLLASLMDVGGVGRKADQAPIEDQRIPSSQSILHEPETVPRPAFEIDLDDMPPPPPKKPDSTKEEGARLWKKAMAKQDAEWDRLTDDIARIRRKKAQGRSPGSDANAITPRPDPGPGTDKRGIKLK